MVIVNQEQLDKLLLIPDVFRPKKIFVAFTPRSFNETNFYVPVVEGRDGEYELIED